MVSVRTPRLVILRFPSEHFVPNLKGKKRVKDFLDFQARQERLSAGNADAQVEYPDLAQGYAYWLCISDEEKEQVGWITSQWNQESSISYLGYFVSPKYRGLGYATEAVRAVVEYELSTPNVKAVVCEAFSDDAASIKVMEKAGLSRIITDLGPTILRYAAIKPDIDIDLQEQNILSLLHYRYSRSHLLRQLLKQQLGRAEVVVPLFTFALIAIDHIDEYSFIDAVAAFVGYAYYVLRRLATSLSCATTECVIQLRESGLFYADRNGFGGVAPWKTYPTFRLPKRGGIEL